MVLRRHFLTAGSLVALAQDASSARRVAVTIDDGPVIGDMGDLAAFRRISAGLIDSLRSAQVPATIFINERQLQVEGQRDARVAVLVDWLDAGFELANHTFSHPSLNRVPLWQFQDDIVRGDVILRQLLGQRGKKPTWFRYPYLDSGATAETHDAILMFLEQRGYRAAPITVGYADYTFAAGYARMLRAGDKMTADKVRTAYQEQLDIGFEYAERFSKELFGYEPPQILLIHCNELNSVALGDSIDRMRNRGYRFVTLDEAMNDKAYQRRDSFAGPGGSWLSRTASALGRPLPPDTAVQLPDWVTQISSSSERRLP